MSDNTQQVQVAVVGFVREGDPEFEADFLPNVINELHRIWLDEALAAKGLDRTEVQQALIILPPTGDAAEVRLNDEVGFLAIGAENSIVDPSTTPVRRITNLLADDVDPDSAWSGYLHAADGRIVVFDFRRYRERVGDLLARAEQFVRSAKLNLAQGAEQLPPAVEDLHAAAELAVLAMALLEGFQQSAKMGKRHGERRRWLENSVRNQELSPAYQQAFDRLASQRDVARYAERPLDIDVDEATRLKSTVAEMIDHARARRG